MTGAGLRAGALTAAVLATGWFGWERLGWITAALGLGWLDPLGWVGLGFLSLTVLDRALAYFLPPPDAH